MATLYVRDLSDEALDELKIRAARRRQSLQAYTRQLLEDEAATADLDDVIDRIRDRATAQLSSDDVTADIDAGRRRG